MSDNCPKCGAAPATRESGVMERWLCFSFRLFDNKLYQTPMCRANAAEVELARVRKQQGELRLKAAKSETLHLAAIKQQGELQQELAEAKAVLTEIVEVVSTAELPDGDPLEVSVSTELWLEALAKAAKAAGGPRQ